MALTKQTMRRLLNPLKPIREAKQMLLVRLAYRNAVSPRWTVRLSVQQCRRIVREMGGLSLMAWLTTAYMLTSTTIVPIAGKLADLLGRKLIYVLAALLFSFSVPRFAD